MRCVCVNPDGLSSMPGPTSLKINRLSPDLHRSAMKVHTYTHKYTRAHAHTHRHQLNNQINFQSPNIGLKQWLRG